MNENFFLKFENKGQELFAKIVEITITIYFNKRQNNF